MVRKEELISHAWCMGLVEMKQRFVGMLGPNPS